MTRRLLRISIAALFAIGLPTLAAAAPSAPAPAGGDAGLGLSYVGTLADLPDRLQRQSTQPLRIWLDRLTSDADAARLAEIVRGKGVKPLERALLDESVGQIQIGDRLGYSIAFARRFVSAEGERLLLIAQRPIALREIFHTARSSQYPFTVVELELDASGHGRGEVLSAARIRVRRNGEVDLENLGVLAGRLLAVRPLGS